MVKQYLFGIVSSDRLPPLSWQGLPLDYIHKDGIGLVITPLPSGHIVYGEDFPLLHFKLVDYLMATHTVLPVRFGTVLDSVEKAQDILAQRREEFSPLLAFAAGKVEMGLKALWSEKTEAPRQESIHPQGKGYLLQRLGEIRLENLILEKAKSLGQQINQRFDWTEDHKSIYLVTPRLFYNTAFLVRKEECNRFWEHADEVKHDFPHLKFLASGPWPLYSFCSVNEEGKSENGQQDQGQFRGFRGI